MLAESARALTNREQAAAFYARLAAEYPQDERAPLAALQAARLDQDRGAAAEAAQRYRDLAARFPKSEAAPEALLAAGYCRAALRQHDEASKDWKTLADQFPTFGKRPEALFRLAQAQVELKQDDPARATLTNLLAGAVPPAFTADANYLMAVLQERAGAADPAEVYYRKALAASPAPSVVEEIQYRRVSVLQKLGKNAEAAEALQSLVSTAAAPRVPLPLLDWLARWQLQENRAAQADAAATALALHGTNDAWRQTGWYLAGRARQAAGQWAEARQAYEKAAALNVATREGVEAAFHLGEVAFAAKDYPGSSTWYARAAELAAADDFLPVRARSYLGLGRAARAVQNWDEAARFFLSTGLLFDHPEVTPEALWGAAEALGKLGRAAERDQTLAELKQRFPDSEWAKKPVP
jgi:TolA-binding protein